MDLRKKFHDRLIIRCGGAISAGLALSFHLALQKIGSLGEAFRDVRRPGRFVAALTPVEIIGEVASAEIERNTLARNSDIPANVWGTYGQVNYHFMFDTLTEKLPALFGEESTFTAITRLDHVEMGTNRIQRVTFGLNFRPAGSLEY